MRNISSLFVPKDAETMINYDLTQASSYARNHQRRAALRLAWQAERRMIYNIAAYPLSGLAQSMRHLISLPPQPIRAAGSLLSGCRDGLRSLAGSIIGIACLIFSFIAPKTTFDLLAHGKIIRQQERRQEKSGSVEHVIETSQINKKLEKDDEVTKNENLEESKNENLEESKNENLEESEIESEDDNQEFEGLSPDLLQELKDYLLNEILEQKEAKFEVGMKIFKSNLPDLEPATNEKEIELNNFMTKHIETILETEQHLHKSIQQITLAIKFVISETHKVNDDKLLPLLEKWRSKYEELFQYSKSLHTSIETWNTDISDESLINFIKGKKFSTYVALIIEVTSSTYDDSKKFIAQFLETRAEKNHQYFGYETFNDVWIKLIQQLPQQKLNFEAAYFMIDRFLKSFSEGEQIPNPDRWKLKRLIFEECTMIYKKQLEEFNKKVYSDESELLKPEKDLSKVIQDSLRKKPKKKKKTVLEVFDKKKK
ncbi:MAG: hypothetical protein Tsb0021_14170 [Chlamydiales bacterium]